MSECQPKRRSKRNGALLLTALALVVLAVAVYISVRFVDQVQRVNWSIVTGVCGGAMMMYVFYKWAEDPRNTVEPLDMILDPVTRRLSLWRVMVVIMFALGVWIIVQWVITRNIPERASEIITLYSAMLASIVAKVASGEWADVKANRQPVPAGVQLPQPTVPDTTS